MAYRVLLNTDGLKVSKPGFDVFTATEENLQFNSNYSSPSVLLRSTINIVNGTTQTYNFGKTFASIPVVYWSCLHGWPGYPPGSVIQRLGTGTHWYPTGSGEAFAIYLQVYNNRVVFNSDASFLNGTPLRLIVWNHEAG